MNHKACAVIGLLTATTTLVGCAFMNSQDSPSPIRLTIDDYVAAAQKVSLGMTKAQVVELLEPSQARLSNTDKKQPDMYTKEGALVEVLYFRSGWQYDALTTDDEFTPYVFKDGKLAAVGWITLGGPKTLAQARAPAPASENTNTTIWLLPIED